MLILQHLITHSNAKLKMVYVFLVVTVRNSYYTRLYVYLNMQKLYFRVNIIARTEFFIISLLHSVTVHNIRNQYRCMPT